MMRFFYPLALFVASFMVSVSAKAQPWEYEEEKNSSTDEIARVKAYAINPEGSILVECVKTEDKAFRFYAEFLQAFPTHLRPVNVKWRINNGEVEEFRVEYSGGIFYRVDTPKSIELARMLINAKQFETSNGYGEILQFKSLHNTNQINRILAACGH